ncbi:type II toxin-antitoxin system HicA family toxin [Anaerobiospirillum thomasii]|uniref:type II toxin-antitoxin system HicA family toxin n=1 Tax=Anaerobiospirillum thomasii TaxID=179995 RepID=UPI001C497F43|nr:type II toxin-antitoxin system HicA family toxin [Anaerobiospirillum thomasii]
MGHNGYVKLSKILKKYGCTVIRQGKGSHEWWYSPISENTFTVSKIFIKET